MHKLKSIARRVGVLMSGVAIVAASFVPALPAFADSLNPLTERSLTLSSSAPGWDHTDGSGNTTYAAPNSGANGQKTGNTFQFKVSSDSTTNKVEAFSFQYCTAPAGDCTAPGDDQNSSTVGTDDASHSDLNVAVASPTEVANTSNAYVGTDGNVVKVPKADNTQGNYIVLTKTGTGGTWEQSSGWTMAATNNEDGQNSTDNPLVTGRNNYVTLINQDGIGLATGTGVKIIFFGTNTNYVTNPGEGAFFVKINDYTTVTGDGTDVPYAIDTTTLQDGGVTVANVMNLSIEIQTKVLETMSFSVGTVDPDTLASSTSSPTTSQLAVASGGKLTFHGICDPILNSMDQLHPATNPPNTLVLGDATQENALSVDHTYSTHSYFRLSSNAAAGATVYYAGVSLSNTEGNVIQPIGPSKLAPSPGSEQFGLALDNGTALATPSDGTNANPDFPVNYDEERSATDPAQNYESGADNDASGIVAHLAADDPTPSGVDATVAADWAPVSPGHNIAGKQPSLQVNADGTSLAPMADYDQGTGVINAGGPEDSGSGVNTAFAFDPTSNQIPVAIANESSKVVDCATGKVRYIANIAATTPAGIYTTKVNYIAAPQY